MNKNNFLRILSLSILLLPLNVYVSEPETVEPVENTEQSYWRQYAPQILQDAGDYAASWVPQSVKDRINSWSTRKKLAIAGAILASLAAVYNRDIILAFVNDTIEKQRQEIFESNVEFGITGIKQHLALTEQRMSLQDNLKTYHDHLMRKHPEDGELIYNEVVSRLTKEGFFEE